MDAPLRHQPALQNGTAAEPAAEIPPQPSSSRTIDGPNSTAAIARKKNKKKKETLVSDCASTASSSNCCCTTSVSQKGVKVSRNPKRFRVGSSATARRSVGPGDVDALGLALGMSIAAVVAQVLERKNAAAEKMSVDYLSGICVLAVRESLGNSTLMTLRLISDTSQNVGEQLQKAGFRGRSCSTDSACLSGFESLPHGDSTEQRQRAGYGDNSSGVSNNDRTENSPCPSVDIDGLEEKVDMNLMNKQLVLHDKNIGQQLTCALAGTSSSDSMLSTIEKSVMEQTRSNDLKVFEIGLNMRRLQLKERQLELNSNANLLERWKLLMGLSKASFKADKFKTQLQETRQVELLKKCLDFLVAGLIMMLLSLAYGTYVYSHRRIIEATEACSPYTESKSWWMPKSMANFNSGLQLLKCQIQVLSRMLFGVLMIMAIAVLLIQRSAASHHTMPVTFILLLLGVGCGYAGKFCIDTLGGSGNHWLIYWEALCSLHFLSNIFHSALFVILNGPITIAEKVQCTTVFPYWMRRSLFYGTLLVLPLLCGLMPFASPWEWLDHFSLQVSDFVTSVDD